jgi:hypothetical protein
VHVYTSGAQFLVNDYLNWKNLKWRCYGLILGLQDCLVHGTPCIIVGIIYHPPSSDDKVMLRYLTTTLISVESLYPGCGILLASDFNQLKIRRLLTQFKMKQLVHTPTRGNNILDLIITNMYQIYDHNSVHFIPPFGLSDHNGVLLRPKARYPNSNSSRKTLMRRDTRPSRKYELGRYLSSIHWPHESQHQNIYLIALLWTFSIS